MTERTDGISTDAPEQVNNHDCKITTATESGRPARTILEYADEHETEHIIMESHGREGVLWLIQGSVAERVIRQALRPITIIQ